MPPPGWEDILEPQEQILWQGRPEARFDWTLVWSNDGRSGLFLTAFSLFWIYQAARTAHSGASDDPISFLFPLFGIPFLLIGLNKLFGTPWRALRLLRGSHYTLTDRNAFIGTELGGKRELQRFGLTDGMTPAWEDGSPGSVWFALRTSPQGGWFGKSSGGAFTPQTERVGFQAIPEARQVFGLMLEAQSKRAAAFRAESAPLLPRSAAPPPAPPARASETAGASDR